MVAFYSQMKYIRNFERLSRWNLIFHLFLSHKHREKNTIDHAFLVFFAPQGFHRSEKYQNYIAYLEKKKRPQENKCWPRCSNNITYFVALECHIGRLIARLNSQVIIWLDDPIHPVSEGYRYSLCTCVAIYGRKTYFIAHLLCYPIPDPGGEWVFTEPYCLFFYRYTYPRTRIPG